MPQYRKLYTKTVESLDVNDMPDDFTRLMWVLLPLGLCREGRGIDSLSWLKAKLFPLRSDVTDNMILNAMACFTRLGMVQRYQVNGRAYFCVCNWHQYQGNTEKEGPTNYPPSPDAVQTNSCATPDPLQTNSTSDAVFNTQYSDADADAESEDSAGAPPPEPKPAVTRGPKKRSVPAAVATFRAAIHRYPPKSWYDTIARAVGEQEVDLARWHQVCYAWVGKGYNPMNVKGMIDCFARKEIPGDNGRGGAPPGGQFADLMNLIAQEEAADG